MILMMNNTYSKQLVTTTTRLHGKNARGYCLLSSTIKEKCVRKAWLLDGVATPKKPLSGAFLLEQVLRGMAFSS